MSNNSFRDGDSPPPRLNFRKRRYLQSQKYTCSGQKRSKIEEKTLIVVPMSYQELQKAFNSLQKDHNKLIELNKKFKKETMKLNKSFLTGKIDQIVFDGLYKGGKITVTTLTGGKISVNVSYTDKVQDINQRIYEQEGIPVFNQRLIFGGRRLKPHRSLYHYKIPINATLHLVMDMRPILCPWTPSDPKEIADDQYYIDEAVRKHIERRQFAISYGY